MHASFIFLLCAWDSRDCPDPTFASVVAHQHGKQLVGVKAVGLRTSGASVYLDTCRIDDEIDNPLCA
ncbi:hypothetical protein QFZ96_001747 [Paraburkholderia youngii]